MNVHGWTGVSGFRAAVRATEAVAALPAVPTQDWCDRAAAGLLTVKQPSIALCMITRWTEAGTPSFIEAAGVAGCSFAEVGTTLGRHTASSTCLRLEPGHPALARLRASAENLANLGWSPERLSRSTPQAAPVETLDLGAPWREGPIGQRWGEVGAVDVVLGATPLGDPDDHRILFVEFGLTSPEASATTEDAAVIDAILPALARRALLAFGSSPSSEAQRLTPREELVLEHLLQGKSVRQIAEELGRSPHTVHDHVKALHRKLNASTRGALVARALGHIDLGPVGPGRRAEPGGSLRGAEEVEVNGEHASTRRFTANPPPP
ncbi:MAG TPA: LuxR C-terminal-related transcriptional regulator [Phycisphaerales bacterium]|nr:LuxR C-terminal-related transcriptional regulator [Phycisphaerales bacterium]